jgi:hypothetical protein
MPPEEARDQRAHYRIPCAGDDDLVVRAWRIAADDVVPREPKPDAAAATTPVDISAGGLGLLVTPEEQRRGRLDRGAPIAALVQRKDARVVVHGQVRRATSRADGLIRLGISVELAEMSLERKRAALKFEAVAATIRRIDLELLARFGGSAPK